MPVYEYHCTSCGKDFEYEHRMSDPRKTVCEACGGELERMISRTSFAFKGGGWYKDLYASSKPAESAASAESKPAADGKAADSKPAAGGAGGNGGSGGGDGGGSSGGSAPSTPSTPPASSSGSGGSAAASS